MSDTSSAPVAIVDYGMGNLFSVLQACKSVGLPAIITNVKPALLHASAVILPGVGAFGTAMKNLEALDLVAVLKDVRAAGIPLIGICLGMQLLMTESYEFGRHRGLGMVPGEVVHLLAETKQGSRVKVPQVGWNTIRPYSKVQTDQSSAVNAWKETLLKGTSPGDYMYFVHSFYCRPNDTRFGLAYTSYGAVEFCSALQDRNLFGCQFHPERSGPGGLRLYANIAEVVKRREGEERRARKA